MRGGKKEGQKGGREGGRGRNDSTVPKILRCQPARLQDPAHGQPGICTKRVESVVTQEDLVRLCLQNQSPLFLLSLETVAEQFHSKLPKAGH